MMRKSLYPNTLFHFTSKENLYSILETTFRPSYAREKLVGPTTVREFGVPMVSFFDLKLSELKFFIHQDYGKFGIGLTKGWANKSGLSPVMYINKHSTLMNDLMFGLKGIFKHMDTLKNVDEIDHLNQTYTRLMNLYRFTKNYEADLERIGKKPIKNYRFANEREWRYVPSIDSFGVKPFIPINQLRTLTSKQRFNASIGHLRLHFDPNDIKYLIVNKESEINPLIDHLETAKRKFDKKTISRLASRILTADQILSDV